MKSINITWRLSELIRFCKQYRKLGMFDQEAFFQGIQSQLEELGFENKIDVDKKGSLIISTDDGMIVMAKDPSICVEVEAEIFPCYAIYPKTSLLYVR